MITLASFEHMMEHLHAGGAIAIAAIAIGAAWIVVTWIKETMR